MMMRESASNTSGIRYGWRQSSSAAIVGIRRNPVAAGTGVIGG